MSGQIDFGYPWWLSFGHLSVALAAAAAFALATARGWGRWARVVFAVVVVWGLAAFAVMRLTLNANGRGELPTQQFLKSGEGRVLDMGAGTGRSTLMVLEERPRAKVVALDLFAESFEHHFGKGMSGQERLLANLKAAGVAERAEVRAGDMRKLPFADGEFDGVVSFYAIDHLNMEGRAEALKEAARVLKPGGDFLFQVIANDAWMKFAFGPVLAHGRPRGADWWADRVGEAGMQVVEKGTRPGSLFVLGRR